VVRRLVPHKLDRGKKAGLGIRLSDYKGKKSWKSRESRIIPFSSQPERVYEAGRRKVCGTFSWKHENKTSKVTRKRGGVNE